MPAIVSEIVEVILFRFARESAEYLLLKRSRGETLYPGLWQVVTGSVREGETAHDAARREVREETGIGPDRFWVVPHVGAFYDAERDQLHLIPFFAAEVPGDAEVRLSAEHEEYRWLEYEAASKVLVWPGQKEGLRVFRETILQGGEAADFSKTP